MASENSFERHEKLTVVTVTIGNNSVNQPWNWQRISTLKHILTAYAAFDVVLFPAGYFRLKRYAERKIRSLSQEISAVLKKINSNSIVCFGIDCNQQIDQLALAVNSEGILAAGRKFYPTDGERGIIHAAQSYNDYELGLSRIFEVKQKRFYLAVCYDCFGIRHCNISNPRVDAVLVCAHRFFHKGEGPSGDVDFARKGFAGASQQWQCPVFGTAVFFKRKIPENWPTGVLWTEQQNVRYFKYQDNQLHWTDKKEIQDKELALCYEYIL